MPSFALAAGVNTVQFTNTYTEAPPPAEIPDPTAGGWTLNSSAKLAGGELQLTEPLEGQAGSAFWPVAVNAHNLTVEYDATIGGGTGADGLALVLADASRGATPTSVGFEGGGLGFSGIPGVAVALDTFQNEVNPSNNFAGVTDGPTSTAPNLLHWLATANLSSPLENATNHIKVVTTATTITVFVNGTQVLSTNATLPTNAYLGFSGATGGFTDRHAISHLVVSNNEPPQYYQGKSACTHAFGPVWSGGLCNGVQKAATKIPFTGAGGAAELTKGTGYAVVCSSVSSKGDLEGARKIVKLKEEFHGCTLNAESCQTKPTTPGLIVSEELAGELAEASETFGGPAEAVHRLKAAKAGRPLFKFACGAVNSLKIEATGTLIGLPQPLLSAPAAGSLSKAGEVRYEEKAAIAGCAQQRYLYVNGAGSCEFPFADVVGFFAGPSWSVSSVNLSYQSAVEIVR